MLVLCKVDIMLAVHYVIKRQGIMCIMSSSTVVCSVNRCNMNSVLCKADMMHDVYFVKERMCMLCFT